MSSVPNEILEDVLLPLDRWTLDIAQFANGRFLQLITKRVSDVCLRQIKAADFRAPSWDGNTIGTSSIRIDGPPNREIKSEHKDAALLFSEFVRALRSSRVAFLTFNGLVFTPDLAALVLQTPVVTDWLGFFKGNFAVLAPTQFHEVLVHFSPTSLNITGCAMRASQLMERLLGGISENCVRHAKYQDMVPVYGGMTDDAIIDFCLLEDVHIGELHKGSFTKELFKRLVEASAASMRTRPLRIVVGPLLFDDDDLQGFGQHRSYDDGHGQSLLFYRYRGKERVFDFPGVQHGADAAMHLQIALNWENNMLELVRARRPNMFFRE